ncbi:hydroxypyruvate isomerase [Kaistia algarum]|uniref:TIM barrel protein n=1 Tax=Kaistia algarum TaxID=2083279 RepID=UPI000CE9374B|nr:TIM barrel protein [Kaistia algarum]MCX5516752.1 TIM barrel protein [Kaistia algarum]PPE78644.1 hydroxypyruvate isomerase [Kaistia algarum]
MKGSSLRYSACIEMLFVKESSDPAERIRLAHAAGFEAFEFWRWTDKNLDAIETAKNETGMGLAGIVAEPMLSLTDPAMHEPFLAGLVDTIAVAQRLGTAILIAQAGDDLPGRSREAQRTALVTVLKRAAAVLSGSGVRLALEPLNTLVDHAGYFLDSTTEGLDIVDEVGRSEIGLLYDLYHSMVMGERPEVVLADRVDRILHIHLADHPGRGEPGSAGLDLKGGLQYLLANGYAGTAGLEYRPSGTTPASIEATRRSLAL